MSDAYSVPDGAKPWVPKAAEIPSEPAPAATEPAPKPVDVSRKVEGLLPKLDTVAPEPEDALQPAEVVDLGDGNDELVADGAPDDMQLCPACGSNINLGDDEIEITEEDKDKWLRHVLGEDRFRQTYSVYDGRMQITFRSRTTEENDMLFKQLTHEINNDLLPEAPYFASPAYVARMNRLMLILSLEKVTKFIKNPQEELEAHPTAYPLVNAENYSIKDTEYYTPAGRAHEQILKGMDEGVVAMLMTLLRRFDTMVSMLVMRSSESDFWTPAGDGR